MSDAAPPTPVANTPYAITAGKTGFQPRYLKDRLARYVVFTGGLGVIAALLLIFVYLASEVVPLMSDAHVEERIAIDLPGSSSETLLLAAEEQGEVGLRVQASGQVTFFSLIDGMVRQESMLPIPEGQTLVSVTTMASERGLLAAQISDGSVLVFGHRYKVTYPDDVRLITPELYFPRGQQSLGFLGESPKVFSARDDGDRLDLVAAGSSASVHFKSFVTETSLFGDAETIESDLQSFQPVVSPDILLLDPLRRWLYVLDKSEGLIAFYRLSSDQAPELVGQYEIGSKVEAAEYLAGNISIVVAQADGKISQWFPARNEDASWYLARVREFKMPGGKRVTSIGPELRRRGFAVGDETGQVAMFYATSGSRTHKEQVFEGQPVSLLAFNPRAKVRMALSPEGQIRVSDVENEHPEYSIKALWGRVWYENYDEPKFLWQSAASSSDFEPKFSMTPLALGTLKGAFYAMIFAIPMAVLGAVFTANFMSPEMRQVVKPAVEVLAALPSVILGFLAGLWLAPFVENHLAGMFLMLLLLPLSMPLFGLLWTRLPADFRQRIPPGWEAALLIPVIGVVVWLCFAAALPIEALFFDGNLQTWMDQELGISFTQRNSLVVGIAMGVCVIPVIFSIAEDAIFSVPKHLSLGSLALGATPWQTLIGVVLPTASPGIFSAIMIGMGRAVGETMIVLMATGNTAVMDFSMFSGMRTLAANVAVEMPESEVGSTHFRLLFVAGLVLFIFTFFLNTIAELVRSRLRSKYSSL